jgi:ATP-dependent Clp protease ATP-binding subunit ClpC
MNKSTLSNACLAATISAVAFVAVLKLSAIVSLTALLTLLIIALPVAMFFRARHLLRQFVAAARGNIKNLRTQQPTTLASWIDENLIGHKQEIQDILTNIERNLMLSLRGRHLGAYLLMGPTGTGKTYFASLLSEGMFGAGRALVIPMSQYSSPTSDPNSIFKLILEQYDRNPEFLLLLDEIDRASPHVQNALFHLLDNGEIIDPVTSERVLLQYVAIVATTNLGVSNLSKEVLDNVAIQAPDGECREALARAGFEKALITRFDGVYLFRELGDIDVITVAILQLRSYYEQFQIKVSYVEPDLLIDIVKRNAAYSEFGVRQLQRLIRNMSDPTVMAAKKRGVTSIVLGFDPSNSAVRIINEGVSKDVNAVAKEMVNEGVSAA